MVLSGAGSASQVRYKAHDLLPDIGADSRFAPCQWEMSLQHNAISHWLGEKLESALNYDAWSGHVEQAHISQMIYELMIEVWGRFSWL